ncbi:S-Ena type endospore appendage [Peribacillus acanthi]|uniref:S-Ena type endospore appendage n=1 Tax=Peribacillus acanthi TaxID=2171554 RepID=UPI000D3EAE7C|nr:S-Ena type endospore appendage [Peribacillus acanthi]
MCGYSSDATYLPPNKFCCPEPKYFVEELCGSVSGVLPGNVVWQAPTPTSDYIQATLTVSNTGAGQIEYGSNGAVPFALQPDQQVSISVNNPTQFNIQLDAGDSANYCIKLYKRIS